MIRIHVTSGKLELGRFFMTSYIHHNLKLKRHATFHNDTIPKYTTKTNNFNLDPSIDPLNIHIGYETIC